MTINGYDKIIEYWMCKTFKYIVCFIEGIAFYKIRTKFGYLYQNDPLNFGFSYDNETINNIIKKKRLLSSLSFRFINDEKKVDYNEIVKTPCDSSFHKMYIGDTKDAYQLFHTNRRTAVKRAFKEDIYCEQRKDCESIHECIRLHELSCRAWGYEKPLYSREQLLSVIQMPEDSYDIYLVYFKKDGERIAIASNITLYNYDSAEYWFGAMDHQYRKISPNLPIQYLSIQRAIEKGFSHYSFGPSSDNEGRFLPELAKYKTLMGGVEHYYSVISINSVLSNLYGYLRKCF